MCKHPFDGPYEVRHSPTDVIDQMDPSTDICYCGSTNLEREEAKTFPVYEEVQSTAQVLTCKDCGRKWELAYSLTISVCILDQGSAYIEHP